jgi:membrane protein required for colicin V production
MNWIDIGIIALLLYHLAIGFRKGAEKSALDFVGTFIALLIALNQFGRVSGALADLLSSSAVATRWLGLMITVGLLVSVMNGLSRLIGHLVKGSSPSFFNRLIGGGFGFFRGVLIIAVILLLCVSFPYSSSLRPDIEQSSLAPSALSALPLLYGASLVERIDRDLHGSSTLSTDPATVAATANRLSRFFERLFR